MNYLRQWSACNAKRSWLAVPGKSRKLQFSKQFMNHANSQTKLGDFVTHSQNEPPEVRHSIEKLLHLHRSLMYMSVVIAELCLNLSLARFSGTCARVMLGGSRDDIGCKGSVSPCSGI